VVIEDSIVSGSKVTAEAIISPALQKIAAAKSNLNIVFLILFMNAKLALFFVEETRLCGNC
jgi:hypothetical protein